MSLDAIYTVTIEMADALAADDIELFQDLLTRRQDHLSALEPQPETPSSIRLLGLISSAERKIEHILNDRKMESGKALERVLMLRDAASEYKMQTPRRSILRDGLAG